MNTHADLINIDYLPEGLQDLIGVVGLDPALAFIKRFGGVRYPVPKKMHHEHELAVIMGFDAAQKMVDVYCGELITFPKFDAAATQIKHHQVRELIKEGKSARTIALTVGYSERYVNTLKADMRNEKQNGFDF